MMIVLRIETVILAPPERCFDLARSVDFHAASARSIDGRARAGRTAGLAGLHDRTTWSARFFGLRFRLTTEVTDYDRPRAFSDVMRGGPFAHFGHVYTFRAAGPAQTVMTDEFSFASPCGILGAVFDSLVLRRCLQKIAASRALSLKQAAESERWRDFLGEAVA